MRCVICAVPLIAVGVVVLAEEYGAGLLDQ
jgi:hypothetical protein